MMAESSRAAGAALVVGHVGRRTKVDWLLRRLLREASADDGVHYFETPVLEGEYRLLNDGHLSEAGHRLLAVAEVEQDVAQHHLGVGVALGGFQPCLGLEDGETYDLDFFFAERHRTQSNFRIVTNLPLESVPPATITAIWD